MKLSDFELVKKYNPLFEAMKNTLQDPIKHAEGDVFTHTQMVLDSILKTEEWKGFSKQEQKILLLTVLFHDVCKPHTLTHEADGSISHPSHGRKGAQLTREILDKENYDLDTIYKVYQTILYHGYPFWAYSKENPQKNMILTSILSNNKWLYTFGKADLGGRICQDWEEWAYRLEIFKELGIENECFDTPYNFYADYDRFEYFRKKNNFPNTQLYPEYTFEIIMLSGLPASGKDSFIREMNQNLPIVSMDDLRKELKTKPTDNQGKIIQAAKEKSREYCRKKQSFIWNATNLTKQVRNSLISIWLPYKPKIKIVFIHKNINQILKDNNSREEKDIVPTQKIWQMHQRLEFPDIQEAHEVIFLEKN